MSTPIKISCRAVIMLLQCLVLGLPAQAQLDSIHWLPPMHARAEWGPQYLYITTPESIPFPVNIREASGNIIATINVSNSQPKRYDIGATNNEYTLVPEDSLQKPLSTYGLILDGPKKFYVNFRFYSNSQFQAGDLTCKGRSGLGKIFRIGHVVQEISSASQRSNFIGIMATEDSTQISLSDFDLNVRFHVNGVETLSNGTVQLMLNAGQTAVISQYIQSNANVQPPNGLIGALLQSSKPIAVNTGSWTGAPVIDNANDVGIDQIAPFDQVGEEYILCKGNGSPLLETPLVIAQINGTNVWLNGSTTPAAVLNAGEYLKIATSQYSAAGNLYISCSQPVFVYQIVGGVVSGDDAKRTAGFYFVPPISCAIPNAVDNIYQPNQIGPIRYDGGLMIVAMKDSTVTLRIDGTIVSLGPPDAVQGNPDFVTYRRLTLFSSANPPNTASVIANGAVQVALFGRNGAAGYGGFYSGFSKTNKPTLNLGIIGDGVCPDTLIATGKFDGVQWYFADSLLQYGPDSFFIAYSPGRYIARGYLGVCRRTDFVQDTVEAVFNSPQFPYTFKEPDCYGERSAAISFGTPSGGLAPYQFSINKGNSFSTQPNFSGLLSGNYDLVVRDSTGCYNSPLNLDIGQPDSLSVTVTTIRLEEPVKPGDRVELEGTPNRPIILATWEPNDSTTLCVDDCLRLTAYPQETTWYTITVTDDHGCTATDRVQVILEPKVFVPNVLSPFTSHGNDRFTLFSKDNLPVNYLRIYDRWGSLVFEQNNFLTNETSSGWDGTDHGRDLTPAVFVFIAEVQYAPGRKIILKGDVTLVR